MRRVDAVGLAVLTLLGLTAGCGGRKAVELNPDAALLATRWNAVLSTPGNLAGALQIKGTGWWGPASQPGRSQASVTISNAAPGGHHPWHVHRGSCGNDMGVVGGADLYSPLDVGSNGTATQSVDLPVALPASGEYMINVHASAQNMGTIIACGNMAPPSR